MDYRKGFWILFALLVISATATTLLAIRYCRLLGLFSSGAVRVVFNPSVQITKIDTLGAQIHSENDARKYIEAAKSVFSGLAYYDEDRLARGEYAAVEDPKKRIPESVVVGVYNQHMQEWLAPDFTPLNAPELHTFREHGVSLEYPRSMQLPDHTIPPDCRPVEALLILHSLEQNGIAHDMRVLADTGKLPNLTAAEEMRQVKADRDLAARTRDAINKYFADHKDWRVFANDTLNQLGIE
jgi:hypothetical protein